MRKDDTELGYAGAYINPQISGMFLQEVMILLPIESDFHSH